MISVGAWTQKISSFQSQVTIAMYGLLQQLFLSFIGIFALIICVPCSAFTSQAKVVRWKLSTDFSSTRLSRTDVRKNFEGRRMSSSIFSSDDDQFPLGSRSDDNWTQSLDQIVEVDDPLASTLGVNLESDRATIDHDTSSTASLYKDIYSVRILQQMHISAVAGTSIHATLLGTSNGFIRCFL